MEIHWCRRYPTKFNSGWDIPSVNTRPYRRESKNDRVDTKALLEAYRPTAIPIAMMAYRSDRRGGKPVTSVAV